MNAIKILLVVYDNDSYIHWFPQGLSYIAAVLRNAGYIVEIYSQDKNHYPDEFLTEYLDENRFDFIGVSVIGGYYQYRKLLNISRAINNSQNRPYYIIGGHGPAPEPEYFFKKTLADAVVIGEGELTIVDLIETIVAKRPLANVKGIAYCEQGKVVINERRALIKDIDSIPFPAYDLFPMDYYRLMRMPHISKSAFAMPILSGRGCPFHCNFCYRMDEGFRPRSSQSIIGEIELLKKDYGITNIVFSDELLMSSIERTACLCEDFIKANLNVEWSCCGRLNFAKPELLKLMKNAGCVFINYGIEAFDDQVLVNMKKCLTTEMVTKGIEATLAAGISPGYNIIFGNIGDNRETLNKGVDFLLQYDNCAQMRTIRPVTPYPGSELYYYAQEKDLLKDCEDFYEHKHVNSDLLTVNFTELSDDEFHRCLLEANIKLIKNYFEKECADVIKASQKLYLEKDASFRGFRAT